MPPLDSPEGMPWSIRSKMPDNDIFILASWLDAWLKAGMPLSIIVVTDPGTVSAGYLMSLAVGNGMTNLGNCIPERDLVASEMTNALKLDEMFAGLQRTQGTAASRVGLP